MICKYCLTKIDDDSVFCENCGNRVTDIGNNDETQLIPKVEEKVIPSRSAAFAANGGKPPEKDFSKLLAEIYDEKEQEMPPAAEAEEHVDAGDEIRTEAEEENCVGAANDGKEDIWVSPDVLLPAKPEPAVPVFCMACGRKLPDGAAFCDMCGTPTGEVSPVDMTNMRAKPKVALPILKEYFVKPADAIDKAVSPDAFSLGAGILLIKDLLLALIAALCIEQLSPVMKGSWLLAGDTFGFGAKLFLILILADVILLALVFGAGILFKAAGTVRETVAVCGTASLLPAVLWMITLLMQAFAPAVSLCAVMISVAVSAVFLGRAIGTSAKIKDSEAMYMMILVMIVYIAVIYGGMTWMIA